MTTLPRLSVMLAALAVIWCSPAAAEEWSRAYISRLPDSAFAVVETAPDSSWWGRWRTFRPSGAASTTANAESGRREMLARDHSSAAAGLHQITASAASMTDRRGSVVIAPSEPP